MASESTKNMTRGNPWRLICGFALPVFLSQVFQQLYNTVDSLVVGKFLGTEALAAVSSSGSLIFLLVSFFIGTATGAGVAISRYFGAGDRERVSKAIHTNLVLGTLAGLVLTAAGTLFSPTFLKWMGTDPAVLPDAIDYFRYYYVGGLAVVLYNVCTGIMNALGDSKRPLYYLIFSSLLNIFLDLLFIAVFRWGVWSAAAATAISQAASVVLCLVHLCRPGKIYTVQLRKLRIDREMLWEILRLGVPSGVQNSVIGFANVIVQSNVNSFGKIAMAGCGSYSKIEGFAFLPITSFAMALMTYVSQNLGAGEYRRARQGSRYGILACVGAAELIGAMIWIFAPALIGLFSQDPGVVAAGVLQARTESLFYCLLAFSHGVAAVCRGAGRSVVPMCIMLACWCVLRIAYITIIMRQIHEIRYLFWAYPMTWGASSVIYFLYYHFSDWIHGFGPENRPTESL
jgi:putative MATE family efflux protein